MNTATTPDHSFHFHFDPFPDMARSPLPSLT
jgi:hypothetical protein